MGLVISGSVPSNDRKQVPIPMHIPDMAAKIDLLLRFRQFRSRAALASHIDVQISTFNGWITGTGKSPKEWVPDKRWPVLLEQFEKAMPQAIQRETLEELVLGFGLFTATK
jgi:hypothetical protein